jgi:V-type H+-transporting ATPase subunit H
LQLEDLSFIRDAARNNKRKLTSIERYEKELQAKKFEWTMLHSSEFWRENATAFEADGFRLIERIRDLLAEASSANSGVGGGDASLIDDTTQAVALFDLGEFAVNHPQGRTVLAAKGVRPVVMAMLRHDDDEVRQQALLATSKMMVARWEFVSGVAGAGAAAASAAAGAGKK